ncbi:hypothetical protein [uncultured Sphaerochaeta sp.]|uniref:hypothetical protein n=1 Tax=uncultured Sphaerochaeta sp. TaxID=886478 RepID=UPI002A0A77BF|nr:hypothetical protein [uncultured Sphaerochaeta sp.]
MKMTRMLQDVYQILLTLSMVLVLWMIINEFTQYDALGFTGLWYELDLRIEGSFATWLESIGMFLCFLPAYAIVRSDTNKVISSISRLFFLALTAAAVFLAADEMLGIHERIGEKIGDATNLGSGTFLEGFAWVFIYGPIMLGGFVLFAYTVRDVMRFVASETWGKLKRILLIIAIAIGTILALEVGEAYLYNILGTRSSLMTLVEESAELVVICGYFKLMQLMYLDTEARPS